MRRGTGRAREGGLRPGGREVAARDPAPSRLVRGAASSRTLWRSSGDASGAPAAYRKALAIEPARIRPSKRGAQAIGYRLDQQRTIRARSWRSSSATSAREGTRKSSRCWPTYVKEQPAVLLGLVRARLRLFAQQKIGEAIKALAKSLAAGRPNAEAHKILGRTLMIIGRFDAAQLEFEQGIRYKPDSAELHYNLGKLFSDSGQLGAGAEGVRGGGPPRPVVPRGARRARLRARGAGRRRGRGRAIRAGDRAERRQRQGRFASAHVSLSAYYNRTGDPDKALDYARKALELDPKSDRAWFQQAKARRAPGPARRRRSTRSTRRSRSTRGLVALLRAGRALPPPRQDWTRAGRRSTLQAARTRERASSTRSAAARADRAPHRRGRTT